MYEKNLTEDFRLRLSKRDMDFLRDLSNKRSISVSEVLRSMIGEYRRSLETVDAINKAITLIQDNNLDTFGVISREDGHNHVYLKKGGELSHGDTETNINDKL